MNHFVASSESVVKESPLPPRSKAKLLHNFRDDKQPIRLGRRVAQSVFMGHRRLDRIWPGDVDKGKSVGGRFDAGNINFFELFNVVKHLIELGAKFMSFLGSQREPRQVRDIIYIDLNGGHCVQQTKAPGSSSRARIGESG